jgi:hypothetical protein
MKKVVACGFSLWQGVGQMKREAKFRVEPRDLPPLRSMMVVLAKREASLIKVSTWAKSGVMHLSLVKPGEPHVTLCGVRWYLWNDHGESYCRKCQRILAKSRKRTK